MIATAWRRFLIVLTLVWFSSFYLKFSNRENALDCSYQVSPNVFLFYYDLKLILNMRNSQGKIWMICWQRKFALCQLYASQFFLNSYINDVLCSGISMSEKEEGGDRIHSLNYFSERWNNQFNQITKRYSASQPSDFDISSKLWFLWGHEIFSEFFNKFSNDLG